MAMWPMPRHSETRTLEWPPAQMFALVADIRRYPEFLPWVVATRIRADDGRLVLADMSVGFKQLRETFTSRVTLEPDRHIHVDYVSGPLKHLTNDWVFEQAANNATLLRFQVDFEFRNRLFERLAGAFFADAFRRMVSSFEARARVLYGSSSASATSAA
jgi:coenzyme Q-binding protein COQ10